MQCDKLTLKWQSLICRMSCYVEFYGEKLEERAIAQATVCCFMSPHYSYPHWYKAIMQLLLCKSAIMISLEEAVQGLNFLSEEQ